MTPSLSRQAYRMANGAVTMAALATAGRHMPARVNYGGAFSGDSGGPLVKARLLKQHFPETRFGFSLVYLLSNALYLPDAVIGAIRLRGIPIVLNQNGVFYPAWYPAGWERENAQMAHAYHRASHVFWQSEFCRRCADTFLGPRSGPGEVLYNAVDTSRFTPATGDRPAGRFRFLMTGKFGASTAYRIASSIDGIAEARRGGLDVSLQVAGFIDAAVEAQMRERSRALGLGDAIAFTGPYSSAQAPAIYQAADAYIITKHNDPCPNVVIEALASGLPVLYSASGGVAELVGSEAGVGLAVEESFDHVVVPNGAAIAQGIAEIIAARAVMATASRDRALGRYGLHGWIARHSTVFDQLVGEDTGQT